jgi:hypothetical protein
MKGVRLTELFSLFQLSVGLGVNLKGSLQVGDDEEYSLLLSLVIDLGRVRQRLVVWVEGLVHWLLEVLHLILIAVLLHRLQLLLTIALPHTHSHSHAHPHSIVHILLRTVILLHPLILLIPAIIPILLKLIPLILLSLCQSQILIPMCVRTTHPVLAEI